ncbi:hypothetical protein CAP31_02085 [Sulfuriferula sp. AH1]|uniref:energy transducer TonB n=1 Tax=Sulfuriferula sp. AH1 TaxID=1985873 RepID=UPI000B3B34D7|nr:energy transducer TonB [Sulfuriferula sp. AH1]ARU30586.1 hypothetical protein CAP31_02085 [Sulfuriferula sp. AH1]
MSNPAALHESELSPAARRVLAALLFSLGLHAAVIGLVRLAPSMPPVPNLPNVLQVELPQRPQPVVATPPKLAVGDVAVMTAITQSTLPVRMLPPKPDAHARVMQVQPVVPAPEPSPISAQPLTPPANSGLPTVNVPLLADNTYYTAKEVDVHPHALHPIMPVYPQSAADRNIQGWVLLKIKLSDTGKVEQVTVGDASPPGVFDQAAVNAFIRAGFAPAQKSGRAVKSLVEIKVWFNLN